MNDESLAGKRDRSYVPWYRRCVPSRRTVAIALLLLITLPFCIRWYRLSLLPDVPLPFDVEAFSLADLPAEENAYYYFKRIPPISFPRSQSLLEFYNDYPEKFRTGATITWTEVPADVQAFVVQLQPSFDLLCAGGRCSDAEYILIKSYGVMTLLPAVQEVRQLQRLVVLDVLRRMEEGDKQGAVEELHAAFRASRHVGRRGCLIERLCGISMHYSLLPAWHQWTRDSDVTAEELEAALQRLRSDWKLTPPVSDHQKVEAVMILNEARRPMTYFQTHLSERMDTWLNQHMKDFITGTPVMQLSVTYPGWQKPVLWIMGEPELSVRAAKLWLTQENKYCDLPLVEQPKRLPGKTGLYDTSERLGERNLSSIDKGIRKSLFSQVPQSLFQLKRHHLEAAWQTLLETELQWQILFRRNDLSAPAAREAMLRDFPWPPDPCDADGRPILFRSGDLGLAIWSRGQNGVDNEGKFKQPDDDIMVIIPWPK